VLFSTERAQKSDIPLTRRRAHLEARRLVGVLQRGGAPSPALVGVLRTADRIARSRGRLREQPREVFPRFRSAPG